MPKDRDYDYDDDEERDCKSRGNSSLQGHLRRGVGEFLFVGLLTVFAVFANTLYSVSGSPLPLLAVGFAFAAVLFAVQLIFGQYATGHGSLTNTLCLIFGDEGSRRGAAERRTNNITVGLVSIGSWIVWAYLMKWILPASFNQSLALTVPLPAYAGEFGLIVFLEGLGKTALAHILLFSSSQYRGMWGAAGSSALLGLLVIALGPVTGGSLNIGCSVGVHLAQDEWDSLEFAAYLVSTLLAALVTVFVKLALFRAKKEKK